MNFSISVNLDLPNVILLKLWFISIQRKRSASQYIKGPQRNWSMYDQRDRWSTYERIISADMILLVQGFGQSHLLLDIQATTYTSELTFLKKKMSKASKLLLMTLLSYEMVICCIL